MSVEVNEKESKYDHYGFSNNYEYDRKVDYPVLKPKISPKTSFNSFSRCLINSFA